MLTSEIPGIFLLHTKADPKKFVQKIKASLDEDKTLLKFTYSWVPVDNWYKSDMKQLVEAMKSIDKKIDPEKTWKIEIVKRHFPGSISDLIKKLTEPINKPKVDLGQPEQIVRVEIIGEKTAISLLAPEDMLNVKEFIKHEYSE
jgi:tRNA(Ser,Leu) C12 N-acetylase TAN1